VTGNQINHYAGVSLEWTVFAGKTERYATQAALEGVHAAQSAVDRVREELRTAAPNWRGLNCRRVMPPYFI